MKTKIVFIIFAVFLINACKPSGELAEKINTPSVFSDNMVLQANKNIKVWGSADPNSVVEVWIDDNNSFAKADTAGYWSAELGKMTYGGPYELCISGKDTIKFTNVMIGEVWFCSGQSNMEWPVQKSNNSVEEIDNADYKNIRLFTVPRLVSDKPQEDCQSEWLVCTPENIGSFSAVGYFFGRKLHKELNVPIGLIHSSWGGTPIESWMNINTLNNDSDFVPIIERHKKNLDEYPQKIKEYNELVERIQKEGLKLPMYQKDTGNKGEKKGWARSELNDGDWREIKLPSFWESSIDLNIDGAIWVRKEIEIPSEWLGSDLMVELGPIDDFDVTYFNGEKIGEIGIDIPNFWTTSRKYKVSKKLVKAGKNVIAVRVFDHFGEGGFAGARSQMKIYPTQIESESLSLAGNWKLKVETEMDPKNITGPGGGNLPSQPKGPGHPHTPASLYNGMVEPVAPFTISGFIWYQGETNANRAYQYRKLLPAMINDWRKLWSDQNLYFGIVQLANYMKTLDEPSESAWAELREAQALTSANFPKTGLAVTIDIGEADDIHPRNKQDVGNRLAYRALNKAYDLKEFSGGGKSSSGPVYKNMTIKNNKAYLSFEVNGEKLITKNSDEVLGFSIAGSDRKFYWAKAEIKDDVIILWNENVTAPVAVRYAWANNPVCNLYNSDGLPAVPFRTDDWPGSTFQER